MNYKFDESQHLHTLDGKALTGSSTVVNVIAKNLTWWAAELAAVECLESGVKIPTIRAEYEEAVKSSDKKKALDLLQKKYSIFKKARYAHYYSKKDSAKKGVDLHAELEQFIKDTMSSCARPYDPKIQPFIDWSDKNVKTFLWAESHSYDEDTFTGGISDAGAILNDNSLVVFDFKSAKAAYSNHFIQAGGYCLQIRKNGIFNPDGTKHDPNFYKPTHIAIVPFGSDPVIPVIKHCEPYEVAFKCAVELYRLINMEGE